MAFFKYRNNSFFHSIGNNNIGITLSHKPYRKAETIIYALTLSMWRSNSGQAKISKIEDMPSFIDPFDFE